MAKQGRHSRFGLRVLSGLMLALAGLGITSPQAPSARAAPQSGGLFVVTITADNNVNDSFLTLQEALLVARGGTGPNGLGGAASPQEQAALGGCLFDGGGLITGGCGTGITDTIVFSSSLGASPVITLSATLPAITDTAQTNINGQVNSVFPVISGQGLPLGTDVLSVTSDNNTLSNLTITAGPRDALVVTGSNNFIGPQAKLLASGRYGLYLSGGLHNTIYGSLIGTSTSGPFSCGQGNLYGIVMASGAMSNSVQLTSIACNHIGILFTDAATAFNAVTNSTIRAQVIDGVQISAGAHDNKIGLDGLGNVISGNGLDGIYLSGSATHDNSIVSNFIGLNAAGTAADGNVGYGIEIAASGRNQVGHGFGITGRNYISGNGHGGVRIAGGAFLNLVESNIIGLSAAGTAAIPNGGPGVDVDHAPGNTIGSSTVGTIQLIGSNHGPGVRFIASDSGFVGQTNAIGLATDLTTAMGNFGPGVLLSDTTNTDVLASDIANNLGAGIAVVGSASHDDNLGPSAIFSNSGLPIDLGNDGPTANDPGDADLGPNTLFNYPVITAFSGSIITGTACFSCTVKVYRALGDPAGPGGGAIFDQEVTADAGGQWAATLTGGLTRLDITTIACTSPCGFIANSSEFSPRPQLALPVVSR